MILTLLGITIYSIPVQSQKALAPILIRTTQKNKAENSALFLLTEIGLVLFVVHESNFALDGNLTACSR